MRGRDSEGKKRKESRMPKRRKILQGETIDSIAFQEGFDPDTVWNHPENTELRNKSKERSVLQPGDTVVIPDKRLKEEGGSVNQRHRFRRKGVPAEMKIRLLEWGEPRAGVDYTLVTDGKISQGKTGSDGMIRVRVPPDAKSARLIIGGSEEYDLKIGHLNPVGDEAGARARLVNLNYLREDQASDNEAFKNAVSVFQKSQRMKETGQLDRATEQKLIEVHGC
jgi:hypothetical protein